ncbi:MAG: hypothetical protein Q9178_001695 [Gyalolechia marmorata]
MQQRQSVALPPGLLTTCHGSSRRPHSFAPRVEETHHQSRGRANSDAGTTALVRPTAVPASEIEKEILETQDHSKPDEQQSKPAVIDFGQLVGSEGKRQADASKRVTISAPTSPREVRQTEDEQTLRPPSGVFQRLSTIARNLGRHDDQRSSYTSDSNSSIPEEQNPEEQGSEDQSPEPDATDLPSRILQRLSYVAHNIGGRRSSVINNARSFRQSMFRPNEDSYDAENYQGATRTSNRNSKAIPKSWRFLGLDGPVVKDAVHNVTQKLHKSNFREMYENAKVRQRQMNRSETGQLLFKYTFYTVIVAAVYLVLVGLPLWRGAVWYMYVVFLNHMVLKAGLAITLGIGFLIYGYAYTPLLINFEDTAPLPEADESGRAAPTRGDTALIIPCYKSEQLISHTLEAALKIFPKESIFVVANGNSPEPLDNTGAVCEQFGVSHTWSPMGSKIIAQFVGCYVARSFPNVLLIDDDCLLPPNLPIVSDRLRGNIKCIGYIMAATGPDGSKGTLCQQAQDLEFKLSGLAKAVAGKVGSVTFPHGCIVLWDRELLLETFDKHPGFSVSEDWFFGHAARQCGSRITMCTSTFVQTEVPSTIFFSDGGARGGFGEMTIWKQRFYRWNYFFVTGMYYNLSYILFDWKLGWWEIGAKIMVFQEIYETILYLLAPFVIPISFAVRPLFSLYLYIAVIVMYIGNALIFNYVHLRSRNETVSFKAFLYYIPMKWVLGFVNIASCYYAIWTYATYFAKRHPKVIEDDKVLEIVLNFEAKETYLSEKGEIKDLNDLMYKIAKPVTGEGGKRKSVITARTRLSFHPGLLGGSG